jgi:polyisoprenoid-binding protein YceI
MSWKIDSVHSEINFTVRHLMISNVRGSFQIFTGAVEFDPSNPVASSVHVEIAANSINTHEPQRDAHLCSPDFLNVAEFPTITFQSRSIEILGETRGLIHGDLTIRGVTHPVTLETEFNGIVKSPFGSTNAGFSATTTINRKDWDLTWNVALETSGWLVGEEIKITIELELIQQ